MNAVRKIMDEAPSRGIQLHLDRGQLVIVGDVTDQFVKWATRHKPEIVAELTPKQPNSGYPFTAEDKLLDQVRSGIGGTLHEVRRVLSYDLADLFSGTLPIAAARHYYLHNRDASHG